jgi:hypothetical protein
MQSIEPTELEILASKLDAHWVFGYEKLRQTDDKTYAFNFYPFETETQEQFLTRLEQNFLRLRVPFILESSDIQFQPELFAIVEIGLR